MRSLNAEAFLRFQRAIPLKVEGVANGLFSKGDRALFRPVVESLLDPADRYLLLRGLPDYLRCQEQVDRAFVDQREWTRKAILNVAIMGRLFSARTVREYAREIRGIEV
jgi:glycogen phosphorylase